MSLSEMYAAWLKEAEALLAQTRAESEAALQQALADVADWTDRYRQAEADFLSVRVRMRGSGGRGCGPQKRRVRRPMPRAG